MPDNETVTDLGLDEYKYDFVTDEKPLFKAEKGLSEELVRQISAHKDEPEWMLEFRLKALETFYSKPMPDWGGDLSTLDLDEIYFYLKPQDRMERSWDDVPENIKETFERLGIPTVATVGWTSDQLIRRLVPLGTATHWTDPSGRVRLAEVDLREWLPR